MSAGGPASGWDLSLSVPGGLGQISGGTLYDRHLVEALRSLGAHVDEHPFRSRSYLGMLGENLRPPPRSPRRAWLQDELGHPGFLFRPRGKRGKRGPLRIALVHNLRSVVTPHRSATQSRRERVERHVVRTLERLYLGRVDAWAAVCGDTLTEMQRLHGAHPAPPARVLLAGKDHAPTFAADARATRERSEKHGNGEKHDGVRFLSVAALAPHKGAHRLLPLLARVPALAHATLTLVGPHDQGSAEGRAHVRALRDSCRHLGLEARVVFRGQLEGEALWEAYRAADVFVLPSDREALPLVGIEALGFGLPLVVTSRGGARELFRDARESTDDLTTERGGFLLAPEDERAWAETLAALALDPALRLRLGRAANERHARLPRWRDTAMALLAFLEELGA